jgi:Ni,Fe-hydrogenase III large subunit/Ni,Fe-hydrogenase III component G
MRRQARSSGEHAGSARVTRERRLIRCSELVDEAGALFAAGFRLATVVGHDDGGHLRVVYVLTSGPPDRRIELQVSLSPVRPAIPTLAHLSYPASRFEQELHDLFGIEAIGHPHLQPLVLHQHWPRGWHALRADAGMPPPMQTDTEPYRFTPVDGPGVYEIPVGPVHAGLIEPGHFRFSVVGETILSMDARLWYVHRGIERLFAGASFDTAVELAERISGDSAVGHNLAFCLAVEDALGIAVAEETAQLRAMLLELERIYNHVADIGALCNDAGFGVAQARALVLREELLRLNREITGHRLLRGAIRPGVAVVRRLPTVGELKAIRDSFEELVSLATMNSVVMDRFRGTAHLSRDDAIGLGVLGVVGRASGVPLDARVAHPFVVESEALTVAGAVAGDVLARFLVRVDEVRASLTLAEVYAATASRQVSEVQVFEPADGSGVGIVEGWRGTIVHRVEIADACLARCKIVDPSFLNWPALSVALADTIVPDFPLANKSFNLSYAGNDL